MKINRQILQLAIPNILSNLSVPLLSSVDTALVGHLSKVYYIGAVAVGGMIFNFVYWGFGFLRMGTTGLTAQAYGNQNQNEIFSTLFRAILVALSCSVLLILLQIPIIKLSMYLINASADVEHHAEIYFNIRIYAAPATLSLYAIQGWFLGMQNARFPLYITLVVNAVNILFSMLFVIKLGMNSNGVAYGTVIAQYSGIIFSIFLLIKSYSGFKMHFNRTNILHLADLKRFLSLNMDIFIRTLLLIFAFTFFTAKSAEINDDILAVNTILLQMWMLFSYGIDGFAFSAESLVGKYTGSNNLSATKRIIKMIFLWGTGLGVLYSLVFLIFGKSIIAIYTDNASLIDLAMHFIIWTIIAPVINSICYIWDGIYLGATASKAMRNSTFIASIVIFLPAYYLSINTLGNNGLWLAMTLFMITRGVTLTFMAKKHIFNPVYHSNK
ncbi:MAG: MATE family efflux transporter [Calditrichaceae bacterium]